MGYNNQKREQKSEIARKKIYQSAQRLFAEQGFESVSVDAIVKDADVSKGSFYIHFGSKDELIAMLIKEHVKKTDDEYQSFILSLDKGMPAQTVLIGFIEHITDVLTNEVGHSNMSLIYKFALGKTVGTDAVMDYQRDIYRVFQDIISRGMNNGEFSTVHSANTLARHCMLVIRGITFEWCIRYPDFDYRAEAINNFKIFLDGIKTSD